jgi:hypothetical protein
MGGEVVPVTRRHKAAHRRLIYTDDHGLIEVPSNPSWVVMTKPPFSRPLMGKYACMYGAIEAIDVLPHESPPFEL